MAFLFNVFCRASFYKVAAIKVCVAIIFMFPKTTLGFVVNFDNSHFFVADCGKTTSVAELTNWLSARVPDGASAIAFGVNAQKSSFKSSVFENVLDSQVPEGEYFNVHCWQRSLKALEEMALTRI